MLMDSMLTHKDVQGSNIKNFGIKRSWVTLKTLATLNHHSWKKSYWYSLNSRLGGPQGLS